MVSLQRKRAEKATADVLAILENQGISDVSEDFDLSSDQETPHESEAVHKSTKEDESSINSKGSRNKSEELSGSDIDSSPVRGRSLSWRGRNDSPRSLQKYKESSLKRRSRFTSNGSSSPKHSSGKSCRQIRGRESKLVHFPWFFYLFISNNGMTFLFSFPSLYQSEKDNHGVDFILPLENEYDYVSIYLCKT